MIPSNYYTLFGNLSLEHTSLLTVTVSVNGQYHYCNISF